MSRGDVEGAPAHGELAATLSRFDAVMIVVGTIIGVGIFFTPGRVAADTGSASVALLAWLVGGAIALTGAVTYARLGLLLPKVGGPYAYLRAAMGELPAFLYGWICLTAIVSGAVAVIGRMFADYLARFFPVALGDPSGRTLVAAGVILLLTAINAVGVGWGARVQNLFSVLKLVSLGGLVVAACVWGQEPVFQGSQAGRTGGGVSGFVSAMVAVLFTFGGWQNLSNVASELKDARRDLGPAIRIGVFIVVAIVLAANVAYLRLLPFDAVATSTQLFSDALDRGLGGRFGDVGALAILCSAFGIVNGLLLSTPRIYFAMARDRLLPGVLGRVHPRFRTPIVAICTQGVLAAALVFAGDINRLLDYCVFADWLFFTLNGIALFVLTRRLTRSIAPDGATPAAGGAPPVTLPRGPFEEAAPWLFTAVSALVTASVLVNQWENARWGLLILAAGAAGAALAIARRREQ